MPTGVSNRPPVRLSHRARAIAANAALVIVSAMAGVLLLELGVRIILPQQLIVARPELYQPDDVLGWRHRENVKTMLNTGEGTVHFRTNGSGYRVPWDAPATESEPAMRILALGDSFLEATAVEAEGTIPELLGQRLSAWSGRRVVVDNTGVGGWDPNQYSMQAKRALAARKYDVGLVFLYIGNDLVNKGAERYPPRQASQGHQFQLPRSLKWKDLIESVLYPLNDLLKTRSHLYQLAKTRLEVPLARLGLSDAYFPVQFTISDKTARHWEGTFQVCDAIRREFAVRGLPVIFTLLPTPYQVDPKVFDKYVRAFQIRQDTVDLDQPNQLLGERFRAGSLDFLDPLVELRQRTARGLQLYGSVDRHLNAAGQEAIASLLQPMAQSALEARRSR